MKWFKPCGMAIGSSVVVDVDESAVINNGWWGEEEPSFEVEDMKSLSLDPGGMLNTKIPWHEFNVEGYSFELQRHRIEGVLGLMKVAEEIKPGCKTFFVWPGIAVTMTIGLFNLLYSRILSFMSDEETFMDSMDASIAEGKLSEHPNILMNIKKEMPDEV